MFKSKSLWITILVCHLELSHAQTSNLDPSQTCLPEGPPPQCSIQGQSDLYGMGVRIGVYLAWLASWIANNFVREEIDPALDTNAIFLLAIVIALALYSGMSKLRAIDGLILIQMSFGFIFSVMTIWGYRTSVYRIEKRKGARRFGGIGTTLRLFLLTSLCTFDLWYFNSGLAKTVCNRRTQCGGLRVRMFVSVSLDSTGRMIYTAIGGLFCAIYFPMVLAALAMFGKLLYKDRGDSMSAQAKIIRKEREKYQCLTEPQLEILSLALGFFNLVSWLFWIVAIELTLSDNYVTGVGYDQLPSAGQLIPLLIGGLGLAKVMFVIIKTYSASSSALAFWKLWLEGSPAGGGVNQRVETPNISGKRRYLYAFAPWLLIVWPPPDPPRPASAVPSQDQAHLLEEQPSTRPSLSQQSS